MNVKNTWINTSVLWLLVISVLGMLLRFAPFISLPFEYRNLLHAHSHLAFLGWIFTALFALLVGSFIDPKETGKFKKQFWVVQAANVGMLLSFPLQGYGFFSIVFSTLHMLASSWFAFSLHKSLRNNFHDIKYTLPVKFLFAGLFFMLISSLGPLALPIISKVAGSGSSFYSNAVYFYLHFQYNGWFTFALFALIFRFLESKGVDYDKRKGERAFYLFGISCLLSYFLSVLWSNPPFWIWVIAGISGAAQLLAIVKIFSVLYQVKTEIGKRLPGAAGFLILLSLFAFGLKVILQFISAIPYVAGMAGNSRSFVIGYLHLVVIGFVTLMLFALYEESGKIRFGRGAGKVGLSLFITGFALSELVIVLQGIAAYYAVVILPNMNIFLVICSALMPLGIFFICAARMKNSVDKKADYNEMIKETSYG